MLPPTPLPTLAELPRPTSLAALAGAGLTLDIGCLRARMRVKNPEVCKHLLQLYAEFPACTGETFAHLDLEVGQRSWPARLFRPQARFISNGFEPFVPLPQAQALPLVEWGLNWCVATRVPNFLVIHAAVVALDDRAIIFPGIPGAGKSTLCAALVARGWRLLSDEFALIHPHTLLLHPLPRPISLKNASIDIILARWPTAWYSPPVSDTAKGAVALFKPPAASVQAMKIPARVHRVIFPRYVPGAPLSSTAIPRARALASLVEHVINFMELPRRHFAVLDRLFADTRAAHLGYSDLDHAIAFLETLIHEHA